MSPLAGNCSGQFLALNVALQVPMGGDCR
jgi:hypothetical protein